jgi:4-hydroxyproline epimerase
MKSIRFVDSHTGGEPTRVVLDGLAVHELETYRQAIVCEPRGNEVIVGALLQPATKPEAIAHVTFFNNVGLLGMCGHGMIGVVETLKYLGRIQPGDHTFETPVGSVTATLQPDGHVRIRNVRSFRKASNIRAADVTGDIAWAGNWFYLVEDHRMTLHLDHVSSLTMKSLEILSAIRTAGFPEVDHVELIGPAIHPENSAKNFVLCPGGQYDRSPCGTGTSAKLACLAASGKLMPGKIWKQESIIGSVFEGTYELTEGGIIPTISGKAYITAEGNLLLDPHDPFQLGISKVI